MDQHLLQGWHVDPFGLHEQRYFSAGRPTKLVRDGRVEAYDEPPAQQAPADGVVAAGLHVTDDGTTGTGLWLSARASTPDGYAGPPDSPIGVTPPSGYPAPRRRGNRGRRRRTGLVNTVVALAAVAAVVTFVAVEGGFSSKNGPKSHTGSSSPAVNLAAFVNKSAAQTLAEKTADVSLIGTTEINGSLAYLRGNGTVDLAASTMAFNLNTSYSGTTIAESEIMTGQALYLQLTVNGQSMAQYLGGKHWMEIPLAGSAAQNNEPLDSPSWSLQLLEQQGARVTAIGSRTVGGLTCNGYAVTPSQHAMIAAAQQEWSEQGLSSSERAAALQMLQNSTPPTISVWLDPTKDLTCELDIAMQMGTGTSAGAGPALATETIQMVLTFTHYGVPVDITAPAPTDTLSFSSNGALA